MPDGQIDVLCECTPVCDSEYGDADGESPSVAVVRAIACAEGVTPTELEPLAEQVDTQALDRLFASDDASSQRVLAFTLDGWNVFVRDDGAVRVCDPDPAADPAPAFDRPPVGARHR